MLDGTEEVSLPAALLFPNRKNRLENTLELPDLLGAPRGIQRHRDEVVRRSMPLSSSYVCKADQTAVPLSGRSAAASDPEGEPLAEGGCGLPGGVNAMPDEATSGKFDDPPTGQEGDDGAPG